MSGGTFRLYSLRNLSNLHQNENLEIGHQNVRNIIIIQISEKSRSVAPVKLEINLVSLKNRKFCVEARCS